ncbi:MAG: DUF2089 family protein [Thermomicrobiales bacterium]
MSADRKPPVQPLITRDPVGGGELFVTRLESADGAVVFEGRFSLGWIAHLSPEQLAFAGQLLRQRGNVQRLAADLGVAYNTARSRLDEIVAALEAAEAEARRAAVGGARRAILRQLAAGEIDVDEALRRMTW